MNETLKLLETRRSVPVPLLSAPGPTPDQIQTLLTIAARVPDHGKLVPWRFILFAGDARMRAGELIAAAYASSNPHADPERLAVETRRFSAPLVVGVVSSAGPHGKVPEWEQVLSAGAVCMNLVIGANAMGFAASWLTEWYAYDPAVVGRLGVAVHEKVAGFIHIGTAREAREDRPRPALADVVTTFEG
jgi:nitroreductase